MVALHGGEPASSPISMAKMYRQSERNATEYDESVIALYVFIFTKSQKTTVNEPFAIRLTFHGIMPNINITASIDQHYFLHPNTVHIHQV